jgi:hypothetical protein
MEHSAKIKKTEEIGSEAMLLGGGEAGKVGRKEDMKVT